MKETASRMGGPMLSYGAPNLRCGPKFDSGIKDLANPRFRKLVEQEFGVELSKGHLLFSRFSPR